MSFKVLRSRILITGDVPISVIRHNIATNTCIKNQLFSVIHFVPLLGQSAFSFHS